MGLEVTLPKVALGNKPKALPKGSSLKVVQTQGLYSGNYDLYDIRGLSLGKLHAIKNALQSVMDDFKSRDEERLAFIEADLLALLEGNVPKHQTVNGK